MKRRKTLKNTPKTAVANNDDALVSFLAIMTFFCLATVYFRDYLLP